MRPWNMAITPDGARLYVANGRSNSVSVIDTQSNRRVTDIPVGERPWGVAMGPATGAAARGGVPSDRRSR
jgi:YVTN family beta-propeller protein